MNKYCVIDSQTGGFYLGETKKECITQFGAFSFSKPTSNSSIKFSYQIKGYEPFSGRGYTNQWTIEEAFVDLCDEIWSDLASGKYSRYQTFKNYSE